MTIYSPIKQTIAKKLSKLNGVAVKTLLSYHSEEELLEQLVKAVYADGRRAANAGVSY
jgi:hypothetical protein